MKMPTDKIWKCAFITIALHVHVRVGQDSVLVELQTVQSNICITQWIFHGDVRVQMAHPELQFAASQHPSFQE